MERIAITPFERDAILLTLQAGNRIMEGTLIYALSKKYRANAHGVADNIAVMIQRKGLLLACIDGKTQQVTLTVPSHPITKGIKDVSNTTPDDCA